MDVNVAGRISPQSGEKKKKNFVAFIPVCSVRPWYGGREHSAPVQMGSPNRQTAVFSGEDEAFYQRLCIWTRYINIIKLRFK